MTTPLPGQASSYWIASTPETSYPPLDGDVSVDVCVIGAGIVGVTAAVLLKNEGRRVALIEASRIVRGVTGYTTAKITSSHNLIYDELTSKIGADGARLYGQANEAGIDLVEELAGRYQIECDFERLPNYVYTEKESEVSSLQKEVESAQKLGLPASFVTESPLPFDIRGAVLFADQAQFHPRKFLLGLAEQIDGDGSHLFEMTRAMDVRVDDDRCHVVTPNGTITAGHAIIATHMPFLDRGLFFAKVHPYRSYALAGEIAPDAAPEGMFISAEAPTRSIRPIRDGSRTLLLVGGEGHKVGQEGNTPALYENLAAYSRSVFGVEPLYRWSTQDNVSVDKVPFIGRLTRSSDRLLTATGFGKWGMANGTSAASMLTDAIVGRPNPYAEVFDAKRINVTGSAKDFVKENMDVAAHFIGGRLATVASSPDELEPGEGTVIRKGSEAVAVHRDAAGNLNAVSAVCTHLGCMVAWNIAEQSWDCPCHGSRFSSDGKVIHGPAQKDLEPKDL